MSDFNFFMPIAKVDKDKRTVSGYASTPTKDGDGEIVTLDAIKGALPDYMDYGNIREMHALKAVGVAQEANIDTKGLFLTAKIVDDAAWQKCVEGVYKGFSIGGRKLSKIGNKITAIEMTEISVVDRPANPDCRMALAKSAKSVGDLPGYLIKAKKDKLSPEAKALAKMAKVVEGLAKANPPAAHDGFSLPATTKAVETLKPEKALQPDGTMSPNDSRPNENITRKAGDDAVPCEAHGKIGCDKCATKKAETGDSEEPYGDVDYADPGHQADGKKRYPIDTEEHIRAAWNYINKPKNAAKYGEKASSVKAKIVSAWKSKIDQKGPPSEAEQGAGKTAKKIAKRLRARKLAAAFGLTGDSFLTLRKAKDAATVPDDEAITILPPLQKSMGTAGSLAYCFDSIRSAQRSLLMEGKREGNDSKDKGLAKQLGTIAKQLAEVISQKATHEGGEAIDLTDADDLYVTSLLGEDFDMNKVMNTTTTSADPMENAVMALLKRAATPSRMQRMAMASDNVKKSRKACKAAREAVEEVHKMLKASYINKAAKKDKKDDDEDAEFNSEDAMGKLQKAYQEIDKARTMAKAASAQIEKAMARSGQRGQETSDAEAGFYEVPPGITDLSPAAIAGAAPGSKNGGSQPPDYPGDGSVYAGKSATTTTLAKYAKNGVVTAEVAQLLMEKAAQEGELDALRRIPAGGRHGQRPFAFDMSKVMGTGDNADIRGMNKVLFDGVDPNALSSPDERTYVEASATVIGNLVSSGKFAKSILDPSFRGMAGTK